MRESAIDISGLDKAEVLKALFDASQQQGMGLMDSSGRLPLTIAEAREYTNRGSQYYDYLRGRVMKVDLSKDEFDPWGYDRDNGQGAAEKAISSLRNPRHRND